MRATGNEDNEGISVHISCATRRKVVSTFSARDSGWQQPLNRKRLNARDSSEGLHPRTHLRAGAGLAIMEVPTASHVHFPNLTSLTWRLH